jgi:hypothetical protein
MKIQTYSRTILFTVCLCIIILGSFMLGTHFPTHPEYKYVITNTEITTRQNLVSDYDVMLGRGMGTIKYKAVYMEYENEGLHIYDGMHSTFIHTPTYGGVGDSGFTPTIDFYGYSFKVKVWNSDYIYIEVLNFAVVPQNKVIGTTIILGRGQGDVHFMNLTLNYNGQDIHITDNKGGWMYLTYTYDLPTEMNSTLIYNNYHKFNIVYFSWDYIKLQYLGEIK